MAGQRDVVVVRPRWFLFLAGPIGLGFGAAAVYTLLELVTGRVDGVGWVSGTVIGLLMVVVAVVGLAAAQLPLVKMTYAADEIAVRRLVRTYRIPLADASEIRHQVAAVHTGVRQLPFDRLVIIGSTSLRYPPRAVLDGGLRHAAEALGVLDGWVRRRPELVAQDETARQVFVDRGVLAPTRDAS